MEKNCLAIGSLDEAIVCGVIDDLTESLKTNADVFWVNSQMNLVKQIWMTICVFWRLLQLENVLRLHDRVDSHPDESQNLLLTGAMTLK